MSNLSEQIISDHNKARSLAKEIQSTPLHQTMARQALFDEYKREVKIHALAEERVVYSEIEREQPNQGELAREMSHGEDEHDDINALLEKCDKLNVSDEIFNGTFNRLVDALEHHMQQEEKDLLPELNDAFSDKTLDSLNKRLSEQKESLKNMT